MSAATKVLAFYSPYPGAGKTTAANHLAYGEHDWQPDEAPFKTSFARPLRSMAASLFAEVDLCFERCEHEGKDVPRPELNGASPRDILIWLGQSGRERFGVDIWSEVMRRTISASYADTVVIDDLRLPDEYRMLREMGAKIVRITIPGAAIVPSDTEARLEGMAFDAEIVNSMDGLNAYAAKVESVYEALIGRGNT